MKRLTIILCAMILIAGNAFAFGPKGTWYDDPVLLLEFEGDIEDTSGYNNSSWWTGQEGVYVDGKYGLGVDLNEGYIEVLHNDSFTGGPDGLSFAIFAKKNLLDEEGTLINKFGSYELYLEKDRISGYIKTTGGKYNFDVQDSLIDTTNWVHYAVTYDGSAVKVFINLKEVDSGEHSGTVLSDSNRDLRFGHRPGNDPTFKGVLDGARIYDRCVHISENTPTPPDPEAYFDPNSILVGETTTLKIEASNVPDGEIAEYVVLDENNNPVDPRPSDSIFQGGETETTWTALAAGIRHFYARLKNDPSKNITSSFLTVTEEDEGYFTEAYFDPDSIIMEGTTELIVKAVGFDGYSITNKIENIDTGQTITLQGVVIENGVAEQSWTPQPGQEGEYKFTASLNPDPDIKIESNNTVTVYAQPTGDEHYVDNQASGLNNGSSWVNAWESFDDIHWNQIDPGDVIYISGGSTSKVYYEMLEVEAEGEPGNNIIIKVGQDSGHNGRVIIDGQNGNGDFGINLQDNVTIDGEGPGSNFMEKIHMEVRNTNRAGIKSTSAEGNIIRRLEIHHCGYDGGTNKDTHGLHLNGAEGCEVAHSYIHHNYSDGYNASGSPDYAYGLNKVHHNVIVHVNDDGIACRGGHDLFNNIIGDVYVHPEGDQTGHPDGIQAQGSYNRIWNNEIYNCSTQGIYADLINTGHTGGNIQIWNNVVYRTDDSMHMQGIKVQNETGAYSLHNILVANNTTADIGYCGIHVKSDNTYGDVIVKNNVSYNNRMSGAYGFVIGTDDNYGDIDYNNVHQGDSGGTRMRWNGTNYDYEDFVDNGYGQSHGSEDEPLFVSYDELDEDDNGQNFHIHPNDTALTGRGDDLSQFFTTDKDGNVRTQWDIGAYAFTGKGSRGGGRNPPGTVKKQKLCPTRFRK